MRPDELAATIVETAKSRATIDNPAPVTGLTSVYFLVLKEHLGNEPVLPEWERRWPTREILNCHGYPVVLARQGRVHA